MLFLTHLAAAALVGRVSRLPTVPLVAGAAFPDLLDKPLGALGLVELYHSIGHSALLVPLFVLLALYSRAGSAAAVGWGSHLFLDALHVVVNGRPGHAVFLLWPLVEPADPLGLPPGAFFWYYLGTPSFYLEVVLWLLLAGLLLRRVRNVRERPE
jgi:hypothetical protein